MLCCSILVEVVISKQSSFECTVYLQANDWNVSSFFRRNAVPRRVPEATIQISSFPQMSHHACKKKTLIRTSVAHQCDVYVARSGFFLSGSEPRFRGRVQEATKRLQLLGGNTNSAQNTFSKPWSVRFLFSIISKFPLKDWKITPQYRVKKYPKLLWIILLRNTYEWISYE